MSEKGICLHPSIIFLEINYNNLHDDQKKRLKEIEFELEEMFNDFCAEQDEEIYYEKTKKAYDKLIKRANDVKSSDDFLNDLETWSLSGEYAEEFLEQMNEPPSKEDIKYREKLNNIERFVPF